MCLDSNWHTLAKVVSLVANSEAVAVASPAVAGSEHLPDTLDLDQPFFAPSAVRHRAQSGNSKVIGRKMFTNKPKPNRNTQTAARATPIPPARIGTRRREETNNNKSINQASGAASQPCGCQETPTVQSVPEDREKTTIIENIASRRNRAKKCLRCMT